MYANRFQPTARFNPGGMGAALLINGGVVAALLFAAPTVVERFTPEPPLTTINIPIPPEPEPLPPPPDPQPQLADPAPTPPITVPVPPIQPQPSLVDLSTTTVIPDVPPPTFPPVPGTGAGTGTLPVDPPRAAVLVDAVPDARVDFQPDYPAAERRAERDGTVVLRVRIGTNGRVLAVEPVSATSDAFFEATRRRALSTWRFKPATRDGVAVESWRRMTVRFTMED